jgi:hypothetical protein
VGEDDDGLVLVPIGERLRHPVELIAPNPGPGTGNGAVKRRHVAHALLRRHLLRGPVVGTATDRIEADEAHALEVEGPGALAEQLGPPLPHVEIPVVLTGDEVFRDRDLLQQLVAELELLDLAELGEVAAEDQELCGRVHLLDVLRRAHRLVDEALIERSRIEMGIRDPGEFERCLGGVGHVDGVDQRPPGKGLTHGGSAEQQRFVNEHAAGDPDRVVGAHPGFVEDRMYLAPQTIEFVSHGFPP